MRRFLGLASAALIAGAAMPMMVARAEDTEPMHVPDGPNASSSQSTGADRARQREAAERHRQDQRPAQPAGDKITRQQRRSLAIRGR